MSIHDLRDKWRVAEIARSRAYEPPSVAIDDLATNCLCLSLNREWIPFLVGALSVLLNPNLWVHEDYDYAPQEIIKLLETLAGSETAMSCNSEGSFFDVRINNGILEKQTEPDGDWLPVGAIDNFTVSASTLPAGSSATATFANGNIAFGIPAGADGAAGLNGADGADGLNGADGADGLNGADGADGLNGADGADGEGFTPTDTTPPAGYDSDQNICAGVLGVYDHFTERYIEILEYVQQEIALGKTLTEVMVGVANSFTIGASDVVGVDYLVEASFELPALNLNALILAAGDTDVRLTLTEELYCAIKDNSGIFTEAIFSAWLETVESEMLASSSILGLNMFSNYLNDVFTWSQFSKWYLIYSFETSTFCEALEWCEEPVESCFIFTFTPIPHNVYPPTPVNSYWFQSPKTTRATSGFGNPVPALSANAVNDANNIKTLDLECYFNTSGCGVISSVGLDMLLHPILPGGGLNIVFTETLEVSNDGTNWTNVYSGTMSIGVADTWVTRGIDLTTPSAGTYLRYRLYKTGYTSAGHYIRLDNFGVNTSP